MAGLNPAMTKMGKRTNLADVQPDLFGPAPQPVYKPDPDKVRNRLRHLLNELRASANWPWRGAVLSLRRDSVLPQLCDHLPDTDEAARWRAEIEAEIARLDSVD